MHMVFFDFKAIGADKSIDYSGGIIKNHQKTLIVDFKSGGADNRVDCRGGTIKNH